jgi:hypothetical protein
LVGLNVPVVKPAAGILVAAASSSVRFTPGGDITVLPPTSDIMTAFCPPGPTSKTSMSPGKVWFTPFSFTVTFKTVPDNPATAMFEGYGVAAPCVTPGAPAGIVIAVAFVNVITQPGVGVGVTVGVGVGVAGVGVGDTVAVGVGVGVAGVGVGGTVGLGDAVGVGVAVGLTVGLGVGLDGQGPVVAMVSSHPVAKLPTSPLASSKT